MRDLIVILAVMIAAATAATFMALPLLEWATGGPEWKIAIALVWLVGCYLLCAWAAMRFLNAYRH